MTPLVTPKPISGASLAEHSRQKAEMTVVGVPKEIKNREMRVGLTPDAAGLLVRDGHQVLVEQAAGTGSGFTDADYTAAGATITDVDTVFERAELIVKVKEPQEVELPRLRSSQILFTYLHLAGDPLLAKKLLDTEITAVAYETVTGQDGRLPLLAPMSAVAGRLATQIAAHFLESPMGGRGKLMGGIAGVERAVVTVIGAGVAGVNAALAAVGLGADVTVLDVRAEPLERLEERAGGRLRTLVSGPQVLEACLRRSDVVIGAALVPGERAPIVMERRHLSCLPEGAVFIDLAIDQGGCAETSRVTSHDAPTYVEDRVLHYCVPNVPALVPRTSTLALVNATLPYVRTIAAQGETAMAGQGALGDGLNLRQGKVMNATVAKALALSA